MKKLIINIVLIIAIGFSASAQWTNDPLINTIVNNLSGSQAVPHIAYDASGNFYVGFYSNNAGNYDIRLQYYTIDGIAQWATELGMDRKTLWNRIFKKGWSVEKALTTPVMKDKQHRLGRKKDIWNFDEHSL